MPQRLLRPPWRRYAIGLGIILFLVTVIGGPYLAVARATQTSEELAAARHTLAILQRATSPQTQAKQAAQLTQIVHQIIVCIENHSDRDTAHILGAPLPPLPSYCPADVFIPPPAAPPAAAAATTYVFPARPGPPGVPGAPGPQGPPGRSAFPFMFTFNAPPANRSHTCMVISTSQATCT